MLKEHKKLTTAQFNKLSKAKKAVLVAQDVLEQIKIKKYIPNVGAYYRHPILKENISLEKQINKNFDKIESCEVCALGSMLLSCTHLGNKLTTSDFNINWNVDIDNLRNSNIEKLFTSIFSSKTLLIIEVCFESYTSWKKLNSKTILKYEKNFNFKENNIRYGARILNQSLSFEETLACNKIFRKFKNPTNRLKYICNNIIANNGQFKP